MTAIRALIGRASPCGCPVRVNLITPDDTPLSVEQARDLMRAQGLRTQTVPAARLIVAPVICRHARRREPPAFFQDDPRATARPPDSSPRRV